MTEPRPDPDLTAILEAMDADAEDEATYKLLAATHEEVEGRGIEVGFYRDPT